MTTIAAPMRAAAVVSDAVGPLPVLVALCLAGRRDGLAAGASIAWGVAALMLLAVVPYVVTYRVRHPRDGLRPNRARKGAYMAGVAAIAAAGLTLLWLVGAPPALLAAAIVVVLTLAVTSVATAVAGWSNHAAACAAGVAMSSVLGGPVWLLLAIACTSVGWARVTLGRHSWGQVGWGAAVGAVVSSGLLIGLL